MKKYKKIIFVTITLIAILSINLVSASNIGISPATINFEKVLRGGYSEKITTITINTEEESTVEITPRGEIEEWLNFSATKFNVSKNSPYYLKVSANPPSDIPNGNYTGFLRVKISDLGGRGIEGQATGITIPVLDLYITIEITDIEYKECRADNYRVISVEEGDNIIFKTDVLNLGNIKLNPKIVINIWDQEQIELLETHDFSETQITPTTKEEVEIRIPSNNLKVGQYWVDISAVDCYSSRTLTFDILEEGSLRANGKLEKIISNPWINEKETTVIEAFFENNGEKDVNALFKGKITYGGKTIQLIESERLIVPIDETNIFEFYFTPQNAGRYIISGRVFYDGKRTYEKSVVINARPVKFNWKTVIKYSIYTILLIGIAFLTYKIRLEKKAYRKKIRSFRK